MAMLQRSLQWVVSVFGIYYHNWTSEKYLHCERSNLCYMDIHLKEGFILERTHRGMSRWLVFRLLARAV